MLTHFNKHKSYLPIYKNDCQNGYNNGNVTVLGNLLYTSFDNCLVITDIVTSKIVEKKSFESNITHFEIFNGKEIVCFADGTIYSNNNAYKMHKSDITQLKIKDNCFITASADKTVKMHEIDTKKVLHTIFTKGTVTSITYDEKHIFAGDIEGNMYQYNITVQKTYIYRVNTQAIVKTFIIDKYLYVFGYDGCMCKFYIYDVNTTDKKTEMFLDAKHGQKKIGYMYFDAYRLNYNIKGCVYANDMFYVVGDTNKVHVLDCDLKQKMQKSISNKQKNIINASTNNDKQSISKNNTCKDVEDNSNIVINNIFYDNFFVFTTNEDEIIFTKNDFDVDFIIAGNNDEITDITKHNNILFIATNSGRLRYTKLDDEKGDYCCKVNLQEGHEEAIMSLKIHNDTLMTCSRDKSVNIYKIIHNEHMSEENNVKRPKTTNETTHCLDKQNTEINSKNTEVKNKTTSFINDDVYLQHITKLQSHTDSVNSCDLNDDIFVSVSKDLTLQIYKSSLEQIFIGAVHQKEINAVKISNEHKIICTASQDKTLKIFDYKGNNKHTLIGHKRGVWNFDFGKEIIASCSTDETIRIWNINNYSCIKVLENTGCSVLNLKIINNDKQVVSTSNDGCIRIWDVKKGKLLNTITDHKEKIWAIFYEQYIYTASVDGVINLYADETEQHNAQSNKEMIETKELSYKLQKYIKEENYIEALKIAYTKNENIYDLVFMILANKKDKDEMYKVLSADKEKYVKYLEKWLNQYKTSDVTQNMVNFAIQKNILTKKHTTILKLLAKQLKASDTLLHNLYTHELVFKNLLHKNLQ
ncbi:U3 small nucleolar RNA-associated protein 13 [Binucleata daphniae]